MKNLDWFTARKFMRQGAYFRRVQWRKWLFYSRYVWSISQTVEGMTVTHVVLNSDFGKDEFLATDWTDEPWDAALPNPYPGSSGQTSTPNPVPDSSSGSPPDFNDSHSPNSGTGTFSPPGGGAGGWGGGYGGADGSGGGGGGGGGGHGGNTPVAPSIVVSVTDMLDGDCFDSGDVQHITLLVEVSIPTGPAGIYLLDCKLSLQTQLGTAYAGYNGSFQFDNVPLLPESTLTATATVTINGKSYTGSGTYTAPSQCGACHEPNCCPGEDGHQCGQLPDGSSCCCCPAYQAPVGPNCECVYVG